MEKNYNQLGKTMAPCLNTGLTWAKNIKTCRENLGKLSFDTNLQVNWGLAGTIHAFHKLSIWYSFCLIPGKIILRLFLQTSFAWLFLICSESTFQFFLFGRQIFFDWWLWADSKIFLYLRFGELLAIISGDCYWNLTLRMFKSNNW